MNIRPIFPSSSDLIGHLNIISLELSHPKNDKEVVLIYLNEFQDSIKTLNNFLKEIERFLLWCKLIHQIRLEEITRAHVINYKDFLRNIPKAWKGKRLSKSHKRWRPFHKNLSINSIYLSSRSLELFFNYLIEIHYLNSNPFVFDRRKIRRISHVSTIDRYLEMDEIESVIEALDNYPIFDESTKFRVIRARYIILLLFYTGLRITEAATHCMGNFIQKEGFWFLRILGKGNKRRIIPVPDSLFKSLQEFRQSVGFSTILPSYREQTPLIPMENLQTSISIRRIDQILKWAFDLGANLLSKTNIAKATKLRHASAHWLRHSYVTYLIKIGADIKVVQENAGHSNIASTMLYCHVSQMERHKATRGLSLMKRE